MITAIYYCQSLLANALSFVLEMSPENHMFVQYFSSLQGVWLGSRCPVWLQLQATCAATLCTHPGGSFPGKCNAQLTNPDETVQ